MEKALGLSLLCVLVGCSDPTGGGMPTISKHDNGKTASRGYMLNDHIKVGDWVYFDEDGRKSAETTYKNGKREGVSTEWHDNGQKLREGTWQNGKVDGVLTEWYANGQKKTEWAFKDGKGEGVWTYWDDKGNVTKTETYKNGKLVK